MLITLDLLGFRSCLKKIRSFLTLIGLLLSKNIKTGVRFGRAVVIYNKGLVTINENCLLGDNVSLKVMANSNLILEEGVVLSDNVSITVREKSTIRVGKNTRINCFSILSGEIDIAGGVVIAPYVTLISDSHRLGVEGLTIDEADEKYGMVHGKIIIGCGSFLGVRSIVLHNVVVGERAIIGANSLVLDDVPNNAIVYGKKASVKK